MDSTLKLLYHQWPEILRDGLYLKVTLPSMARDTKGWTLTLPMKVTEPSMARDTKGLTLPSRLNTFYQNY